MLAAGAACGLGDFGGQNGVAEDRVVNAPMAFAALPRPVMRAVAKSAVLDSSGARREESAAPRVREYFPETMYWNPSLITDDNGQAELRLPMADSITTWRMSLTANSMAGQSASATDAIKVFQQSERAKSTASHVKYNVDQKVLLTSEIDDPDAVLMEASKTLEARRWKQDGERRW